MGIVVPDAQRSSNDHNRRSLDAVHSLELLNAPQRSLGVIRVRHCLLNPVFVACGCKRKYIVS